MATMAKSQAVRADIERALRGVGAAGASCVALGKMLGRPPSTLKWHLAVMDCVHLARTKSLPAQRWFHTDYMDAAQAYLAEQDAKPRREVRIGPEAVERMAAAVMAAGTTGIDTMGLAAASGIRHKTAQAFCVRLASERGWVRVKRGHNVAVYFPPGTEPPPVVKAEKVRKPKAPKPAPKPRQVKAQAADRPLLSGSGKIKRASLVWNAAGLNERHAPASRAAVQGAVDYSRAKITKCPSCYDMRHTVHKPEPFFSALAIGNYLPADTWTARVYGGAR